jgi:tetraprenyl-beta-curcumene synthase
MRTPNAASSAIETGALVALLVDYWTTVFPQARKELERWRRHAARISDLHLRELALRTLDEEGGLAEGAALLATLVPRRNRDGLVGLLVAWQVAYDYLDTIGEQLDGDPLEGGKRLYEALGAALDPAATYAGYAADGGYLDRLIACCRAGVGRLSSYDVVQPIAVRAAMRCAQGQTHTHGVAQLGTDPLRRWAQAQPGASRYLWWEVAAGAISSLAVHAVLATAALPAATAGDAVRVDAAYFPSICALSTLLDSTIDQADDAGTTNHRSTVYYDDGDHALKRLETITRTAWTAARALPGGRGHAAVLAGMTAFYAASGGSEHARVHDHVASALGLRTAPLLWSLRLRGRLRRVAQR